MMISINPNEKTERENYKILTGSVIPRPIAFITTLSEDGVVNAAPFSYFNIVSSNPPLLSVSVQRSKGEMKDTSRNIMRQKEFVIHIVDEDIVHNMNKTAASLARSEEHTSELQSRGHLVCRLRLEKKNAE